MIATKEAGIGLVKAMIAADYESLRGVLDKDVHWHLPASVIRAGFDQNVVGREGIVKMVSRAHANQYKDMATHIEHVVAEGDFTVVLCRHDILAHNGQRYSSHYVYFMRFRDGLVIEAWELTDTAQAFEMLKIS